jgi:hypothetical protein
MPKTYFFLLLILVLTSCGKQEFEQNNNDPVTVFNSYWHELDRNYSFFSYSNLNWDSIYAVYRPKVNSTTSSNNLFQLLTQMTNLLNDAHTNVYTPLGITGNIDYFNKFPINQISIIDPYFNYLKSSRVFEYGLVKSSNLGYIKIKTFDGKNTYFEEIDSLLVEFKSVDGLIIDVRSNRGGEISNSEIVASRFADSARIACKCRVRNGSRHDDFTNWMDIAIAPCKTPVHFFKPIVLLTNRQSFSATEWFVLFSDVLPNVTTVGDTTGGGSAIPLVRELSNGWILRTSNTQTMIPSGRDYQFTGLYPDIPIWINTQNLQNNIDTILEKAISLLKK